MRISTQSLQSLSGIDKSYGNGSSTGELTWTRCIVLISMSSESTANSEPSYLTVAQLAQRLQVSESTIYGWVDRDYIPFLMAGDLVRFDPTAIHNWMLAEADRKREKKRGLRAIRGKLASAPGGCNRKGATG